MTPEQKLELAGVEHARQARIIEDQQETIDELRKELDIAHGFHKVAVAERNAAWRQVESLQLQIQSMQAVIESYLAAAQREDKA